MRNIVLFIFTITCTALFAQNNYTFANITEDLKKNANYIIWEDFKEFEVIDKGTAIEKVKFAVCIVDQYSKNYNTITAYYNKNEKISGFKAEIFDKDGNSVKKIKSSEIKDVSAVSGYSLFDDSRVMYADFIHGQYPYTLVYEYEKKVDGLLFYPSKYFQLHANTGILSSQINVIVPNEVQFKHKEYNLSQSAKITEKGKKKMYTWTEKNIKPFESIELPPSEIYYEQVLKLAPVQFAQGGYEGELDSWDNFGKWILKLNKEKDILPETRISEIKSLVKDAKTDKEKVRILYKYMQDRTRYVSVQLGIGGFQPFTAEYVDTKGYGDCKALTNYMFSLLKAVGIKSNYVLVSAGPGENDILTDFPSSQFNHVILCVPQQKDSIWLECTSQQQAFNFLGSFTNDRHVLLITETGAKLVKTPQYGKSINTQVRKSNIKIGADGNASGNIITSFNGIQYENREGITSLSAKEQKDALKNAYTVAGLEFKSFKFIDNKDEIPSMLEQLDISILGFAPVTNKRMFVKLNIFNETTSVPKNEVRKVPFQLRSEFIDSDTIVFEIPEGYDVENIPQAVNLKTKFGTYSAKTTKDGNLITSARTVTAEKALFPVEDYVAFYEYRKQIVKADKAKLVLVKKI